MTDHILVPIDGSGHADKALGVAAQIAAANDASLSIIHVLIHGHVPRALRELSDVSAEGDAAGSGFTQADLPRSGGDIHLEPAEAPRELLEDIAGKLLGRAAERARKLGVARVDTTWCAGDPARAILDQAQKHGADTIVMGARGLSELAGLVTGSVSHKVQHLFGGTVITVS